VDLDPVAAVGAEHAPRGLVGVELGAVLVEARELKPGAEPDQARVRLKLAREQAQQRGLAGAVRPQHADPVAAQDAGGEGLQDCPAAEALGDPLGLDHEPAAEGRRADGQLDRAGRGDQLPPLLPQLLQVAQPAHVALAPRGDTPVQPMGLGLEALVEALDVGLLCGQHLPAPFLKAGIAAVAGAQRAAIEPPGAGRKAGEEAAVVADDDERAGNGREPLLQPFDGRQVEMVGGLVEQQHLGLGHQRLGQGDAADLAAGKALGRPLRRHAEVGQEDVGAVAGGLAALGRGQAQQHEVGNGRGLRQPRLLRQIGDGHPWLGEHLACVELSQARQHAQEGGLARAVAADEAHAIAARQLGIKAGE
jgi:hypothetical protein